MVKRYKLTFLGVFFGIILYLIGLVLDIDLFEFIIEKIYSFELIELDEILLSLIVVTIFLITNILTNNHEIKVEREKYKIYNAMLNSIHHILNNFINQSLIVKLEAENSKDFNKEVITIYEEIIDEATKLTKSLESVKSIDEDSITDSVKP